MQGYHNKNTLTQRCNLPVDTSCRYSYEITVLVQCQQVLVQNLHGVLTFYHSDTWHCSLCTHTSRSCCQTSEPCCKRSRKLICKPSHNNNAEKRMMSDILHKQGEFLHIICACLKVTSTVYVRVSVNDWNAGE